MTDILPPPAPPRNDYPTSDGRPMAETDIHRQDMNDLIETLQDRFAADQQVYVSGNLLLFYIPGDRRRHLSPDVFVVRGVAKRLRENYLVWQEGKGPDVVIELTSASTREEDIDDKYALYQNTLRVPEYFLFDPKAEYLTPPLQGHRLIEGRYYPIEPLDGRLPSEVLDLHLERRGNQVRLYDPATRQILLTPKEQRDREAAGRRAAEERHRVAEERHRVSEEARRAAEEGKRRAEAENERLRREIEELRRRMPPQP